MNRNLEAIASAAARECERQDVDEAALVRLLGAHHWAVVVSGSRRPTVADVFHLGHLIEPAVVPEDDPTRRTPVTFASGGSAVAASLIVDTLASMWRNLDDHTDPVEFTRAFLDVHPFRDGNGRTAWVLFNWLARTLGNPLPLPDFYGTDALVAVGS